jgi:hypothetical protein
MAIAFSRSRIIERSIPGTSISLLRAGLNTALTDAGWVGSSVTGGYKYVITTRQGLQAACWIRDLGIDVLGTPALSVHFGKVDGSLMGLQHLLVCSSYRESYDIIANECQMFVGLHGHTGSGPASESIFGGLANLAVCGGVPYVPLAVVLSDCGAAEPEVSELWWSSGSRHGFRSEYLHPDGEYSSGYDGDVQAGGGAAESRLRLAPLSHAQYDFSYDASPPQLTQWADGTAVYTDPLLLWGAPVARVRGQIWDAMLGSLPAALDAEITTEETDPDTGVDYAGLFTWRNYLYSPGLESHYSALYLLTQVPDGFLESNYAY